MPKTRSNKTSGDKVEDTTNQLQKLSVSENDLALCFIEPNILDRIKPEFYDRTITSMIIKYFYYFRKIENEQVAISVGQVYLDNFILQLEILIARLERLIGVFFSKIETGSLVVDSDAFKAFEKENLDLEVWNLKDSTTNSYLVKNVLDLYSQLIAKKRLFENSKKISKTEMMKKFQEMPAANKFYSNPNLTHPYYNPVFPNFDTFDFPFVLGHPMFEKFSSLCNASVDVLFSSTELENLFHNYSQFENFLSGCFCEKLAINEDKVSADFQKFFIFPAQSFCAEKTEVMTEANLSNSKADLLLKVKNTIHFLLEFKKSAAKSEAIRQLVAYYYKGYGSLPQTARSPVFGMIVTETDVSVVGMYSLLKDDGKLYVCTNILKSFDSYQVTGESETSDFCKAIAAMFICINDQIKNTDYGSEPGYRFPMVSSTIDNDSKKVFKLSYTEKLGGSRCFQVKTEPAANPLTDSAVLKLSLTYCIDLHRELFSTGFAPALYSIESPSFVKSRYFKVLMEDCSENYTTARDCIKNLKTFLKPEEIEDKKQDLAKQLETLQKNVLAKLKEKGYVHGDLRLANILVRKNDEYLDANDFKIIDFDFSVKQGAKYGRPEYFLNGELPWPEEIFRCKQAEFEHDQVMLSKDIQSVLSTFKSVAGNMKESSASAKTGNSSQKTK